MRRTNRIDNQFMQFTKLSKSTTTGTILSATTQHILAKDAATICTSVYAREGDKTKFFEEACAFRAEAVAGQRRAGQLIEAFREAVAAVQIQAAARQRLARARQRSSRARDSSRRLDGEDERRTRRLARSWLALAKRLRLGGSDEASSAIAQTSMADKVKHERARTRAALRRQAQQQRRSLEQLRLLLRKAAAVQIQTAWRSIVQRRHAEHVWKMIRERREAREARARDVLQRQAWREEQALMRRRRQTAALRLQACARGHLTRRRIGRRAAELGHAERLTAEVRQSVGRTGAAAHEDEPAWLREAEERLTGSSGATRPAAAAQEVCCPMSGASRLRSTRVGALSPTQLIFPSPPNAPSSPLPKPSPPAPRRHDGEAWRSGGRHSGGFTET